VGLIAELISRIRIPAYPSARYAREPAIVIPTASEAVGQVVLSTVSDGVEISAITNPAEPAGKNNVDPAVATDSAGAGRYIRLATVGVAGVDTSTPESTPSPSAT